MQIGIPKEIKDHEYRVGATPELVKLLSSAGHRVCIQSGAGKPIGYSDERYQQAGATLVQTAAEVYQCELVVKVKEPQPEEFPLLRHRQSLFCFLHLAAEPRLTEVLMKTGTTAIAFDTVIDKRGRLPILMPMSEIAGRLSIPIGATALQIHHGGLGVLLGGVPGVAKAKVVILGGGVAGTEAARMALGCGADVVVLDRDPSRLRELENLLGSSLSTRVSTPVAVEQVIPSADLVIGAVLIPGKRAPKLISQQLLAQMKPGAVFIDISIDQGGCAETSRPTTHAHPTYVVDGVIHYCVPNMPGACALTATQALTNVTSSYILVLANMGVEKAINEDPGLREGLNVCDGAIVNRALAADRLGHEDQAIDS